MLDAYHQYLATDEYKIPLTMQAVIAKGRGFENLAFCDSAGG